MKRRGVALLGLGMVVAGGIWAAVAMADTRVEITKPSGSSQEINVDEDDYDKKNVRYKEGDEYNVRSGLSLETVLKRVGIGDRAWTTVEVGGLIVQNGSYRSKKPPIFFVRDDDVYFYRPQTATGSYQTRDSSGGDLDMSYEVPLVLDSSDDTPKAGQAVTYEVSVPGGGPQSAYEFTWSPSSGTGGTGSKFKYKYPETSGEVTINVTAKRGSDNQKVGVATTASTIKAPPEDNSGDTGGIGTGGSGYDSGYNYDSGYTPPSDFGGDYSDPGSSNPEPNFPETPEETPEDTTLPEATSGTSVSGELLAAVAPLEPSSGGDAAAGSPEEEATTPEDEVIFEENEEVTAPGALIAAGVVIGIIGLGAGREIEDVRPRRFLRRPNFSGLRRLLPPWK